MPPNIRESIAGPAVVGRTKLAAAVHTKRFNDGKTMREAADAIGGVSAATLCRIEAGDYPSLRAFKKIVTWLGVTADSVLEDVP